MQKATLQEQIKYLSNADPILATVIEKISMPVHTGTTDYFKALVESIVSQQLSIKAADTIFARFIGLFNTTSFPSSKDILAMPDDKIRAAGISYGKISYIKDLAQKVDQKLLDLHMIVTLEDEEVILHLTEVKGIGRWTAEMFLMFSMGRPDIFSYGDLGLRNAIQRIYNLRSHPSEKKAKQISNKWKPYRTLACRYLWKSLEFK